MFCLFCFVLFCFFVWFLVFIFVFDFVFDFVFVLVFASFFFPYEVISIHDYFFVHKAFVYFFFLCKFVYNYTPLLCRFATVPDLYKQN